LVSSVELDTMNQRFGERAQSEPGLDTYRVGGDPNVLDLVPEGWFVSDAVAQLVTRGGWWPGEWGPLKKADDVFAPMTMAEVLTSDDGLVEGVEPQVRWLYLGRVWERDSFFTPITQEQVPTAPLLGISTQALWHSMVFPTEASLLEAFIITYDELGLDPRGGVHGRGGVDPFFVEWITEPPLSATDEDAAGRLRVHERLVELSSSWTTSHRCWSDLHFPIMNDNYWPPHLTSPLLGVPPHQINAR